MRSCSSRLKPIVVLKRGSKGQKGSLWAEAERNWCQEADGGGRGFVFHEGAVCEGGSPWLTGQKRCQVNVTGK